MIALVAGISEAGDPIQHSGKSHHPGSRSTHHVAYRNALMTRSWREDMVTVVMHSRVHPTTRHAIRYLAILPSIISKMHRVSDACALNVWNVKIDMGLICL